MSTRSIAVFRLQYMMGSYKRVFTPAVFPVYCCVLFVLLLFVSVIACCHPSKGDSKFDVMTVSLSSLGPRADGGGSAGSVN